MAFWSARTALCDQHKTDQLSSSSSLLLSLLSTLVLFAWSMMGHAQWHANLPAPDTAHFRSPPALPATTLKPPSPRPQIYLSSETTYPNTRREDFLMLARAHACAREIFSLTSAVSARIPHRHRDCDFRLAQGGSAMEAVWLFPVKADPQKYRRLLFQPYADLFPSARKLSHLHPQLPRWLRCKFMISPFD